MQELGELDQHFEEFARRGVRVVAVSVDDRTQTALVQQQFPHLTILADPERKLTQAINALHAQAGPDGSDVATPTTLLVDGYGKVRWAFRHTHVIARQSPGELLDAVDEHLTSK